MVVVLLGVSEGVLVGVFVSVFVITGVKVRVGEMVGVKVAISDGGGGPVGFLLLLQPTGKNPKNEKDNKIRPSR